MTDIESFPTTSSQSIEQHDEPKGIDHKTFQNVLNSSDGVQQPQLDHEKKIDIARLPTNKSELYTDPEMRPPIFKNTFHEVLCIILVAFAPAAASMSGSAFQVSLREVSEKFDTNGGKLTWCVSSVMLANGSCLLLMGGIADAFGRRNALIIGYFFYALFSLIAGFMNDFILLCLFRALQGACVGCAVPAAAGFLGSTYKDSKRKNMVMSCFGIGPPAGGASGYFIGGVCLVIFNWRAIHFFLSIWFGLMSVAVALAIPKDPPIKWTKAKQIFAGLDYMGAFISLCAFVLICFALTQVDAVPNRWNTSYIIATLVVGIALLGVFVLYENKVPKNPLMPMKMFTTRNFNLSMIIASFSWMVFFGCLNYNAVLYFEKIKDYKTMIVACCFLTQPVAGTLVNIFAGFTMHIIPGHVLMAFGCAGFLVASIIWATNSMDRNYFLGPFWAFIFTVVGADLIYNVANRCTLSSVDKSLQSRAAGTFNTVIQLSSSVGLGLSTTILASKFSYYGTTEQDEHFVEMFFATKYVYYFSIALSGSALCLCPFLKIGVLGVKKVNNNNA